MSAASGWKVEQAYRVIATTERAMAEHRTRISDRERQSRHDADAALRDFEQACTDAERVRTGIGRRVDTLLGAAGVDPVPGDQSSDESADDVIDALGAIEQRWKAVSILDDADEARHAELLATRWRVALPWAWLGLSVVGGIVLVAIPCIVMR